MKDKLKINQISPEVFEWYKKYLTAVDTRDADGFGEFLDENAEFQFGNQPKVTGKKAIVEGLKKFWATYEGDEHILYNILGSDDCFALEADNIYTRKDGKKVTCPAVAITERNNKGLVTSFRVFIDIAPLYA